MLWIPKVSQAGGDHTFAEQLLHRKAQMRHQAYGASPEGGPVGFPSPPHRVRRKTRQNHQDADQFCADPQMTRGSENCVESTNNLRLHGGGSPLRGAPGKHVPGTPQRVYDLGEQ